MALFDDDGLVKFADLDALRRWDNRTWDKAAARKVACDEMTSTAVADDIPWGKKRFMRSLSSAPLECQNPTEGDILELTTADDREFDNEDPPPFEEDLQQQTPVELQQQPQQPKKKSDGKRRRDRERRKRMKEREKEYKRKVAVGAMTRRDVEKEKIKRHVESEMQKRRSEWKKMMQEEMRRKEEKERRKLMANIEEDRQCSSKKADRFRRFNRWRK